MKVGDLVKYDTRTQKWAIGLNLTGLVIETGRIRRAQGR
jgi:hypothetical protein